MDRLKDPGAPCTQVFSPDNAGQAGFLWDDGGQQTDREATLSEQDESAPKQEPQMEEPPDTSWVEMEIIRKDNGTYETREQE